MLTITLPMHPPWSGYLVSKKCFRDNKNNKKPVANTWKKRVEIFRTHDEESVFREFNARRAH